MSHLQKVECISFAKYGEYFVAQFAIDGQLGPPVECHASVPDENHWNDAKLMAYMIRSTETMLEIYGDARLNRPLDQTLCPVGDA